MGVIRVGERVMAGTDDSVSVLERLRPKLILAFKFDLVGLANFMLAKGFLSENDCETVTALGSTHNNSVKAGVMVDSLISKVKINPNNYKTFLKLVDQQKKFSDVVYLLASGESNSNLGWTRLS